jgi:predicted Holliday junction resolvase-like endonuclease
MPFRNGIQLPYIIVDFVLVDLMALTDEELVNLRERLDQERSKIAEQLKRHDQKRRTEKDGDFSGPSEWEKKARFTKDVKGRQIQCIQDEQRRRRIRIGKTLPQVFMDGARQQLDTTTFETLYRDAKTKLKSGKE